VTGQNRFIPLRDGVISQEFEQSLLGADVARIAEECVQSFSHSSQFSSIEFDIRLSFGWYESIFASYLARKVSHLLFISNASDNILARQSGYIDGSVSMVQLLGHSHDIFQGSNLSGKAMH